MCYLSSYRDIQLIISFANLYLSKLTTIIMSVGKILLDTPTCSVVDRNYNVYIDHYDPLVAENCYSKKYNPTENNGKDDKWEKMFPGLMTKRDPTLTEFRHLITVSKSDTYKLAKVGEKIGCKIVPDISTYTTREEKFRSDDMLILDYTDKSFALFVYNDSNGAIREIIEKYSLWSNPSLTGPDGKKCQGWVIAKSNRKLAMILDDLMTLRTEAKSDTIPPGRGVENLPNKDGKQQLLLWGTVEEVEEELADLENYDIGQETEYPDGRVRVVVTILDD